MFAFIFFEDILGDCFITGIISASDTAHALWVLYMSYSMYEVICLRKNKNTINVKYIFIITVVISLILAFIVVIKINQNRCLDMFKEYGLFYMCIAIILPQIIVLLLIVYYYYWIRISLNAQIADANSLAHTNKRNFRRIYGYSIVYLLMAIANIIYLIQYYFPKYKYKVGIARLIIYGYYPLFNSLVYGMTQSSKEVLEGIIQKDSDYLKIEEQLNKLRDEQTILPRPFFDLAGISDHKIDIN